MIYLRIVLFGSYIWFVLSLYIGHLLVTFDIPCFPLLYNLKISQINFTDIFALYQTLLKHVKVAHPNLDSTLCCVHLLGGFNSNIFHFSIPPLSRTLCLNHETYQMMYMSFHVCFIYVFTIDILWLYTVHMSMYIYILGQVAHPPVASVLDAAPGDSS